MSRRTGHFNPSIIDELVDLEPTSGNINSQEELYSKPPTKTDQTPIDLNKFSDSKNVYAHLAALVQSGNDILGQVKYMLDTNAIEDAEYVNAASNLLNSIKEIVKEFTKIHTMELQHQKRLELEEKKLKNRKELLKLQYELEKKKNDKNNKTTEDLFPYCQEKLLEMINEEESSKK